MKHLILGDSSFLGYYLGKKLSEDGEEVCFLDINHDSSRLGLSKIGTHISGLCSNDYSLNVAFSSFAPDYVYFLYPPVKDPFDNYSPIDDWNFLNNSLSPLGRAISLFPIKKLFLRSSNEVYGIVKGLKNDKSKISEYCPHIPISYRGAVLHSAETYFRIHCYVSGVPFVAGRVFEVFGEDMSKNPVDLLHSTIKGLLSGKAVAVPDVNRWTEFISVDDVVSSVLLLTRGSFVGPINISSGKPIRIKSVFSAVEKELGRKKSVVYVKPTRDMYVKSTVADISQLLKEGIVLPDRNILDSIPNLVKFYSTSGA